jgi:hypothetical protein
MMRALLAVLVVLTAALYPLTAQQLTPTQASYLVHEVVYNELHDHEQHGYWRYWIQKHTQNNTLLEEQIETTDGPIDHLIRNNGQPLNPESSREEQARLADLLSSPSEQARHRKEYFEDEKRIGRILALLPDAFAYTDAGEENGRRHLHFRPNPDYTAHSVEARVFHAMSGDLWLDTRYKHMARLDGHLEENLDFGYGILGRIYKGGWFRLERTQAGSTDWKTIRLEVHMTGRAMLFKTIARETSETRGGFVSVPRGMDLQHGLQLLEQDNPKLLSAMTATLTANK